MNRDDIFRMGREAGFAEWENTDNVYFLEVIVRFAVLVAAAEREACAKVCDDLVRSYWNSTGDEDEPDAYDCAAAIRARGTND